MTTDVRLDDSIVETFRADGVVVLRNVLSPEWLGLLAEGVEYNAAHPSPWAHWYTDAAAATGFWTDYVTWQQVSQYERAAFESPLPTVARRLMATEGVHFFHEHVLVKEPGATEPTPWHHDQPYYCLDGTHSVSLWVPLDPVPAESALRFVTGSHLWGREFVPRRFIDQQPYADADGRFEILPDIDAEIEAMGHRVITTPVQPGDVVAFHFLTVHGAPGNSAPGRRRAVSFRYVGDDAVLALRPWLHSPPYPDVVPGRPIADDLRFPRVAG